MPGSWRTTRTSAPRRCTARWNCCPEHGIVEHVHLGHGPAEWHLSDDRHLHLVCDDCGRLAEVADVIVQPFVRAVESATGYEVDLGHFALTGRCPHCARTPAAPS